MTPYLLVEQIVALANVEAGELMLTGPFRAVPSRLLSIQFCELDSFKLLFLLARGRPIYDRLLVRSNSLRS